MIFSSIDLIGINTVLVFSQICLKLIPNSSNNGGSIE